MVSDKELIALSLAVEASCSCCNIVFDEASWFFLDKSKVDVVALLDKVENHPEKPCVEFDFNQFHYLLYHECKKIFPKIIAELSDENIYSIALYSSGSSWVYLFPTVATEKGLSEAVAKYRQDEYYQNQSIDALEARLRWSPCDSPRHITYASSLKESEKMLRQVDGLMDKYWENAQDWKCNELHQQLVHVCLDVLSLLDREGIFKRLQRSSLVLNLLNGDQSDEERLERARILNPQQGN